MRTEIKRDSEYYTLYVEGIPTVSRESLTICESVRDALEGRGRACTESDEVAESIRKWRKSW